MYRARDVSFTHYLHYKLQASTLSQKHINIKLKLNKKREALQRNLIVVNKYR